MLPVIEPVYIVGSYMVDTFCLLHFIYIKSFKTVERCWCCRKFNRIKENHNAVSHSLSQFTETLFSRSKPESKIISFYQFFKYQFPHFYSWNKFISRLVQLYG